MWTKLPPWIWIGAWILAFLAGMVNVVGLLGFQHEALTHMTGLTSRLSQGIAEGQLTDISTVAMIMASFVTGATISGLLIDDTALQWGRRYGLALCLEALFLALAAVLVRYQLTLGFCLASLACGLQNAMASSFSGSVIRTTHVSGMFTDVGISLGHWMRRAPVNRLRMRICVSTITGFAMGGVASAMLFRTLGTDTLFFAAGIALLLAIVYHELRTRRRVAAE